MKSIIFVCILGLHDLGAIKLDLTVCLAIVYFLMYICICKGVKSTGKAVYITAVLPYLGVDS